MFVTLHRVLKLRTLKQRLRFWVGFTIVSLGLLILGSTYLVEVYQKTRETDRHLKETLAVQQLFIERWTADHSSQIRYLSKNIAVHGHNQENIAELFHSFISSQDEFAAVVYVEPSGITSVDSDGTPGVNVSDRAYFQAAKEGREFVTDVIIGKSSGKPIVIFSSPVTDEEGKFGGLVFGSIHITNLERLMGQFKFGDSGETYLLDRLGRFVTSPREYPVQPLSVANRTEVYDRAVSHLDTAEPYRNYKGNLVMGQYAWTKDNQWLIVAEMNRNAVFESLYINMLVMAVIVLAVLIISAVWIVVILKHIERPLNFLLIGTKIIRDGNYGYQIEKEEIDSAPAELQQLCDTFNVTSQKLKTTIELLEQTAVVDQLTEVYNRRFIMNEGNKLLETCIRALHPCSVLMIDIDFFKKVNDTYGHLVGDRVIIYAASILMSCIRTTDMVSRYGGEEFLILAPNTEAASAGRQLGERIRHYFEANPYQGDGIEIPLSVSIGVSDYLNRSGNGKTVLEDMISCADIALYEAKNRGRNRVEIYQPEVTNREELEG